MIIDNVCTDGPLARVGGGGGGGGTGQHWREKLLSPRSSNELGLREHSAHSLTIKSVYQQNLGRICGPFAFLSCKDMP
ncbi:hypothetical protein AWP56_26960 [Escherichia coli]|nr:hypothetical protein AWP56_26960 [Escherichia coli]